MSIEKLRKAIAPCCGLGANRTEVDAALNQVEALIAHRENLLMEVLNVLQSSLDAMKGHRFKEDEIINHISAMKAIREIFKCQEVRDFPCLVEIKVAIEQPAERKPLVEAVNEPRAAMLKRVADEMAILAISVEILASYRRHFPRCSDVRLKPVQEFAFYSLDAYLGRKAPIGERVRGFLFDSGLVYFERSHSRRRRSLTPAGEIFMNKMAALNEEKRHD